jgi:two-component system response regulator EvgA
VPWVLGGGPPTQIPDLSGLSATPLNQERFMNNEVLIIDDHPAVRMTVRLLLQEEGYSVIGEADNGVDALQQIQTLQPALIILDIGLPKIDGLTLISRLKSKHLSVKIIVLTGQESNHIAQRCMQAGAHGFVNKKNDLCDLVNAARTVKEGQRYFPNSKMPLPRHDRVPETEAEMLKNLTTRELIVLQQLVQGLSNNEIAERMFLSNKTISTYKTRLLAKLNATSILDLYDLAKRNGLTESWRATL